MRTTLKRGIGRGATVEANGRPVLPPGAALSDHHVPPAGAAEAIGLGDAPHRPRLGIRGARSSSSGLGAGGAYLWFHQSVAAVVASTPDVKVAAKRLDVALPGQPATALVIGYDKRAGEGKGDPSRSDTIMLVRADPDTKSVSLLSFPRDLFVKIYCPGKPTFAPASTARSRSAARKARSRPSGS